MKQLPAIGLIGAFIMFFAAVLPTPAQTPAFTNGGFESGSTAGWTVYNPGSRPYSFTATNNAAYVKEGSRAGMLSFFDSVNDSIRILNTASLAGTTTGALLNVSLWLRLDGIVLQNPANYISPVLVAMDAGGNALSYAHVAGSFSGTFPYIKIDFLLEKPANATQLQCQVFLGGGFYSGRLLIDSLNISVLSEAGPASTSGLLDARLTPDAGGTPRLTINGTPEPPTFYFGNSFGSVIYDEITKAASANVRLIQLDFQLPWDGFSTGQMTAALARQPNALFLPRFNLSPSANWLAQHPLPMVVTDNGEVQSYPSLASDALMDAWKHQLDLLVHFLRRDSLANKVIGYHPGYLSGGEWFYDNVANYYYDYSEANRSRFQAWATARYGTLAALNIAWNKSLASLNDVTIPPTAEWSAGDDGFFRNPATRTWMTDYQLYFNNLVADRINELAAYIKQLTDNKALFCSFYGYQYELLGNSYLRSIGSSGHLALRRVIESPNVDIICSPISYVDRQPGGPSNLMGPEDSITLAGKMQLQEDDSRTHLWVSPPPEPSLIYPTEFDSLQCLRRNFGNVLSHNLGIWWMDLQANGNYNSQAIWDSNKKLVDSYAETVAEALPSRPQVALISDEDSAFWLKGNSFDLTNNNNFLRVIFQELGAQVGYYQLEDVDKLPDSVRLIVVTNAFRLSTAERTLLAQLKSNNRTVLWMYAPGYVTETALSASAISTLTGFTIQRLASGQASTLTVANNYPPITQGLTGHQFGTAAALDPLFCINPTDTAATVLATYASGGKSALGLKDFGTWRSVFCGAPVISVAFARALARYAGVVLLNDGQSLTAEDAVQNNGRYIYVYARGAAGNRSFQLPFELVPNGGFERDTNAIPSSGNGQWITLASGSLVPAIAAGEGHQGSQGLKLGPFTNGSGQYAVPLLLRLANAREDKTYTFSAKLRIKNLNTSGAGAGDYIYLQVSPAAYTPGVTQNFNLAEGTSASYPNDQWMTLSGTYTHHATSSTDRSATIYLVIYGAYSADAIVLDDVSLREADTQVPAKVVNILTDETVAVKSTGWVDDFQSNEQKIYRLVDPVFSSSRFWALY